MIPHLALRLLVVLCCILEATSDLRAYDAVLALDSALTTARRPTRFGASGVLPIDHRHTALLRFDLTSSPMGMTAENVAGATLTVFLSKASSPGTLSLRSIIAGSWDEDTIPSGLTISDSLIASVQIQTPDKRTFVCFDVTEAVRGWFTSPSSNRGLALASDESLIAGIDSKENAATGHQAKLSIEFTRQLPNRGFWSAASTYQNGDIVTYAGSSWIALAPNTNSSPSSANADWNVVAQPGPAGPKGDQGLSGLTLNGQQVALLKWSPNTVSAITVGTSPGALCYDGQSIWVLNHASNSVNKLNPATGQITGTYTTNLNTPWGICYDGLRIWVTNRLASGQVIVLNAGDGSAAFPPINVGSDPHGLCFDGSSIWVTNHDSNSVSRINARTGIVTATYTTNLVGPTHICFDGNFIWVSNYESTTVAKLNQADGTHAAGSPFPVGQNPAGICFDGTAIWVANINSDNVMKLDPATGAILTTVTSNITNPQALCSDGVNIWVANYGGGSTVSRISPDGTVKRFPVGSQPYALCFDGAHIWVANVGGNSVNKL